MANKPLYGLLAIIAMLFVFVLFVGLAPTFSTLLLVVGILGIAKYMKVTDLFPIADKKTSGYVGGAALALSVLMIGGMVTGFDYQIPFMPGSIGGLVGDVPSDIGDGVTSDDCWTMASDELRGKTSTPTINAFDRQSNTPFSAAVDVNPTYVYMSGSYLTSTSDTSDYTSITNAIVGKVMEFYPAGTTYYGEYKSTCIHTQGQAVELDAHAITTDSGMDVACTDESDASALSAAGNTTQSDYDITMGADEETTFYCKWKANTANVAFQFGAIAIGYQEGTSDTIDQVSVIGIEKIDNKADSFDSDVTGRSFIKETIPKFIQNYGIFRDGSGETYNATDGYEDYYEMNTPLLLEEWESIKVNFDVESGGTDPAADTDSAPTTKTAFYLYGLDSAWTRGSDGNMYLSTHTVDTAQDNVGLAESWSSPVGSTLGVAIELI